MKIGTFFLSLRAHLFEHQLSVNHWQELATVKTRPLVFFLVQPAVISAAGHDNSEPHRYLVVVLVLLGEDELVPVSRVLQPLLSCDHAEHKQWKHRLIW